MDKPKKAVRLVLSLAGVLRKRIAASIEAKKDPENIQRSRRVTLAADALKLMEGKKASDHGPPHSGDSEWHP